MNFLMDDILETLKIMKECDDSELHIEMGDMKLSIFKGDVVNSTRSVPSFSGVSTASQSVQVEAAPTVKKEESTAAAPAEPAAPAKAAGDEEIPEGLVPIRASVTSVFYRKPSPEQPPFVEVGDEIEEDTVVCLLDVMKCYSSVMAGVRGRIEKILVESGQLVESGAVLFLVRPT